MREDKVELLVEEIRELVARAYNKVDSEYAAKLLLDNPRKTRMFWLKYYPSRRAVFNRMKPITTIGLASLICIKDYCWHNLFIDIDNSRPATASQVEQILVNMKIPTLIYRTMKGFHIYGLKPMSFKEALHILTKIKVYVDRKWLSLQRKRKLIIIRVAGKYENQDIKLVRSRINISDNELIIKYAAAMSFFIEISRARIWRMIRESKL